MQLCLTHKEVKLAFLSTQWDQETMRRSTNAGMESAKREVLSSEVRSRGEQGLGVWTPARPGTGLVFHDKWVE